MRCTRNLVVFVVAVLALPGVAQASRFTPLEWQQPVNGYGIQSMDGQRKHTTWVRDRDRDFVDDLIVERGEPGGLVNVIIDLNDCLPLEQIDRLLRPFGRISYIGKMVTFVMLDDVRYEDVWKIAKMDGVAMVELNLRGQIMTDVSARSVQAKPSVTFSPSTAG